MSCSSGMDPLLDKLLPMLGGQISTPLCSPSPLLSCLLRAAFALELASLRREASTQTDSCLASSPERRDEGRRHKKRKRKKESKPRKKKKEKRRKSYCSSPSYSDFEPENPILRRNLR